MSEDTTDIQSAARLARVIEMSRGILHGIALGDAADHLTSQAPVRLCGVATQLTLATTEGMVCTIERAGQGLGIEWGHENLESLRRWARIQGISGVSPSRSPGVSMLDDFPGYAERRGSAPATVSALRHGAPAAAPGHASLGAHSMVRTLPFAVLLALRGPGVAGPVQELVGTTHGHPLAAPTAVAAALLAARAADQTSSLASAWLEVLDTQLTADSVLVPRLGAAVVAGTTDPRDPAQLAALAPDRSAVSVLAAAVYVTISHPRPDELRLAMALASFSPDKRSTSAVVGGLLGARWGSTPMLRHGAGRNELAWACDALATDLAMTAMLTPLAKEPDGVAWLPSWGARYLV